MKILDWINIKSGLLILFLVDWTEKKLKRTHCNNCLYKRTGRCKGGELCDDYKQSEKVKQAIIEGEQLAKEINQRLKELENGE